MAYFSRPWRWLAHLAVGLIALPFIVRQNSWFEWANTLWLLDLQTAHVAAHGLPTYFIDAPSQFFYPNFVFYAGTTFSVLAYPAVVLGTWPVFAAATAGAFVAASAGVSWTARNLDVPSRLAILPGVLFALTPYTVSNLYGRGAWTELIAVGALSVAVGAATSLIFARARNTPWTVAVLALAVAAVAGTHNITLLFSALVAPLLALSLLPLLHAPRRELIRRHLLVLAGAATGVALCGVFLAPDIWLSGRTVVSTIAHSLLKRLNRFDSFSMIFNPVLGQPHLTTPTGLHTETLVVPLVWLAVTAGIALRRRLLSLRTAIALAMIGTTGAALALLITHPAWWLSFPSALQEIQFTFRLVTFLALFTVLGVIALLATPSVQRSRLAIIALLLSCVWQVGLATNLALTAKARGGEPLPAPTPSNVRAGVAPPAFTPNLLQARQFRLVAHHPLSPPELPAQVGPTGDDTPPEIVLTGSGPTGTLVATDVVASPLIHVAGQASVAGASADGYEVLRVNSVTPAHKWRATVSPACNSCLRALAGGAPLALLAGKLATLVGALALLGLILAGGRSRRHRGIRAPTDSGADEGLS